MRSRPLRLALALAGLAVLLAATVSPITHWKPTGWFSAMFDPMIRMESAF